MQIDMHESDWRVFRRLHSIALERFSKRALEEVRKAGECKANYHDFYRRVLQLIGITIKGWPLLSTTRVAQTP